jgi:hypothetical protein
MQASNRMLSTLNTSAQKIKALKQFGLSRPISMGHFCARFLGLAVACLRLGVGGRGCKP